MKTFTATQDDLAHEWHVVDATDVPLGRLASEVAQIIRGKHKPPFTPHMDTGDFVIVINASKVALTGTKIDSKQYFRHTGYMGHERYTSARNTVPSRMVEGTSVLLATSHGPRPASAGNNPDSSDRG